MKMAGWMDNSVNIDYVMAHRQTHGQTVFWSRKKVTVCLQEGEPQCYIYVQMVWKWSRGVGGRESTHTLLFSKITATIYLSCLFEELFLNYTVLEVVRIEQWHRNLIKFYSFNLFDWYHIINV